MKRGGGGAGVYLVLSHTRGRGILKYFHTRLLFMYHNCLNMVILEQSRRFFSIILGFILDNLVSKLDQNVCFGDLGCFSTAPPFRSVERPVDLLPKSPTEQQIKFYLHTRYTYNSNQRSLNKL